jgi:uncharacterized protein with FMN-binding domain
MRRAALALFSTVAGLVVLLGFKTHSVTVAGIPVATGPSTPGTAGSSGTGATSVPPTAGATSAPAPSASASASARSSSAPAATTKTVTGDSVDTRWGPVQVQITVQNGTVTAVDAVVYPQNNPRDVQINSYAIPALNQEALTAKSAQIDMISGATYTSEGYLGSLQSALDKAGL